MDSSIALKKDFDIQLSYFTAWKIYPIFADSKVRENGQKRPLEANIA